MKSKLLNLITTASYYPRLLLDAFLFLFVKNDYSILDKFNNQDCLIVGNGPSLKKTSLEQIKMISIGMNKINILFDKTSWRPDLIVCTNGLVIRQNLEFFNTTEIPLILPVKALYLGVKKRKNVIFVKISNSTKFQENISKSIGMCTTVTYACLQVAAFADVKSVNLVGVDHSFKLDSKNKKNKIEVLHGDDQNHFDPNYFKDMQWGYPDLKGSEEVYVLAKSYFKRKNIPIKDFTISGKLHVFEKEDIKSLYKKS